MSYSYGRQSGTSQEDYRVADDAQEMATHHGGRDSYYNAQASMESSTPPFPKQDYNSALSHAQSHYSQQGSSSGSSEEDHSIFSSALSMLNTHGGHAQVDEGSTIQAHQQMYGSSSGQQQQQATSETIGSGAALEALKIFTSSGGSGAGQAAHHTVEGRNSFVGIAMAQASRLFDSQAAAGNAHSEARKEDAVAQAAKVALAMYNKNSGVGGGSGSGAGGLMNLAGKFFAR